VRNKKALLNKNVFSLVLNVLNESHDCTDSGRLYQTTDAITRGKFDLLMPFLLTVLPGVYET